MKPFDFEMSIHHAEYLGLSGFDGSRTLIQSGDTLTDDEGREFLFVCITADGTMVWRAYNGRDEWAHMVAAARKLNEESP